MRELLYCIESSLVLDKPSVISGLKEIASGKENSFKFDKDDVLKIIGKYEEILDSHMGYNVDKSGRIRIHNSNIRGLNGDNREGGLLDIETVLESDIDDLKYVGIDINYEGFMEASLDYFPGDRGDIIEILNYEHPKVLMRTKIPEEYESLANDIYEDFSSVNMDIENMLGKSFLENKTELCEKHYDVKKIEGRNIKKAYV